MSKKAFSKAFTIIELLIVIVVVGILAAITVVGYSAVTRSANDKAVQVDISKFADSIKLKILDTQTVPVGGATSSLTGDSSVLSGITFKPNDTNYDKSVSNFFYCAGKIDGGDEFGIIVRSKSGKAFSFLSNEGVSDYTGYTWTTSNNGVGACTALGFTAPFTWSYGFYPATGWYSWATP